MKQSLNLEFKELKPDDKSTDVSLMPCPCGPCSYDNSGGGRLFKTVYDRSIGLVLGDPRGGLAHASFAPEASDSQAVAKGHMAAAEGGFNYGGGLTAGKVTSDVSSVTGSTGGLGK